MRGEGSLACALSLWRWRRERRQTFKEAAPFEGLTQSIASGSSVGHPLTVGRYHVFPVGEHPVEAWAARDYVLEGRLVPGPHKVIAVSGGEPVGGEFAVRPVGYEVASRTAYNVVRA